MERDSVCRPAGRDYGGGERFVRRETRIMTADRLWKLVQPESKTSCDRKVQEQVKGEPSG